MPAKGKHRRPKSQRLTRSIAAAGTGGAALALPLIGAAGAHAATPDSAPRAAAQQSVQSGTVEQTTAAAHSGTRTYSVRQGDWLAKIAEEQGVSGGWQRIYQDNREAIGGNPSLIHPGLKLTLGERAGTGTDSSSTEPSSEKSSSAESAESAGSAQPSAPSSSDTSSDSAPVAQNTGTAGTTDTAGYGLPVNGARIGTAYHTAGSMWSSGYHTGVDFVVPTGTSLKAVGAGTVVSAGWGGAYGNQVVLKLADGYYAQYAHLSRLSVSAGQTVTPGQQIGLSGATGNVTGPHLHFEIRTTANYGSDVDPLAYLRTHGVTV
ncbi:LysM peptidoglycan-binding domain-containing M23 family metallopeptidase [Streptomyces sp. NPDC001508]|uniref:M23 family metallopeptidase n=1 Tax=Streptomyces sp. NPDC001508 TaxID=3154656 RepID=UPI00331D18B4